MSEFLASAAEKMGVPEALVRRSADARAKASGSSTDDVLNAWAGGESAPAASAPEPAPAQAEAPAPEAADDTEPSPTPEPAPAASAPATPSATTIEPVPTPTQVTPQEALDHPVVITVPTMGITERTLAAVPRWIAAAFFLIPAFGLLYMAGSGSAGGAVCDDGDIRPREL
jgi:hypothetical protein